MMVIIHGVDRSEYCLVKKKYQGKHFFETKEQLYTLMPEGMCRIKIDRFGDITSDECLVFPENYNVPYDIKGNVNYSADAIMAEIDLHKGLKRRSWWTKARTWFSGGQGGDLKGLIKDPTVIGIILAIILVGPAILGMVFK